MIANILTTARYARVLRLLDLERKLILNGPLTGLAALVERREIAMAEILDGERDLPEAFLAALKSKAERNSALILASLAGVRAAVALVEEVTARRDRLRTYTAGGASIDVQQPLVTRDHKA